MGEIIDYFKKIGLIGIGACLALGVSRYFIYNPLISLDKNNIKTNTSQEAANPIREEVEKLRGNLKEADLLENIKRALNEIQPSLEIIAIPYGFIANERAISIQNNMSRETPIRILEKIIVNDSNDFRFVVNKGELEGINDLRNLAYSSKYEEGVVYFPELRRWEEVGRDHTSSLKTISTGDKNITHTKEAASITVSSELMSSFFDKYSQLAFYHTHPLSLETLEQQLNDFQFKNNPVLLKEYINALYFPEALPSFDDEITMIKFSKEFYKKNPEGSFACFVASPLGLTEFGLTRKGIEIFKEMGKEEIRESLIKPKEYIIHMTIGRGDFDPVAKIRQVLDAEKQEGIYRDFIPYSELFNEN